MMPSELHHIYLLTGEIHGGKTTFLSSLSLRLMKSDILLSGILSEGFFVGGRRSSYELVCLPGRSRIPLASAEPRDGWFPYRRFHFNPEAFEVGAGIIREGLASDASLIILDEVGPMELDGRGWAGTADLLAQHRATRQIWVVREGVIELVRKRWNIPAVNLFRAGNGEVGSLDLIVKLIFPEKKL